MNNTLSFSLRAAALATTLLLLPVAAFASNLPAADRASQLLSASGTLPVKAAGPYVEVGSFRILVSEKLGQPSERLADGTWIYQNFCVEESAAAGALVVRFDARGQVSDLSLVIPTVVAALRDAQKPTNARLVVAVSNPERR